MGIRRMADSRTNQQRQVEHDTFTSRFPGNPFKEYPKNGVNAADIRTVASEQSHMMGRSFRLQEADKGKQVLQ